MPCAGGPDRPQAGTGRLMRIPEPEQVIRREALRDARRFVKNRAFDDAVAVLTGSSCYPRSSTAATSPPPFSISWPSTGKRRSGSSTTGTAGSRPSAWQASDFPALTLGLAVGGMGVWQRFGQRLDHRLFWWYYGSNSWNPFSMDSGTHNAGLQLVDDLVAAGKTHFTFDEVVPRIGRSPAATANLLRRMVASGLVDRVRRGHYVVRQIGVLGTRAAAEDVAIAVGAAFLGHAHRMAYRTALDEQDLIAHPARTIYVATARRMRVKSLSGRPLRTIAESETAIRIGAMARGPSWISTLDRALLDAAARPALVGGAAVLAEAMVSAGNDVDAERLTRLAKRLGWASALRRIGSIADALEIEGLAGRLQPLRPPTADLDLEPGLDTVRVWRDRRWRVRWALTHDELANAVRR